MTALAPIGLPASYVRHHGGHTMTVHGPAAFDPDAFARFTAGQTLLGLDVETSAIDDKGPRHFDPGFTVRLVQFGSETEAWVLDPADEQLTRARAACH